MYDVIIIGKGPAGISASLYTARANLKTLVIGKNNSSLRKAGKIENYYGFSGAVSGERLLEEGEKQATKLGVDVIADEVISITKDEVLFEVTTTLESFKSKAVLLATGQPQKKINIENIESFEGRGVSYCTTCDGFFYKNLRVGVLGNKDYAVHEAMELKAFTKDITIYTNGKNLEVSEAYTSESRKFKINEKPVIKIDGKEYLEKIYFEDGSSEELDGLFVALKSASSIDFSRKLGIVTDGNSVVVDANQQTNLEGLFAAGDCIGGFKQISTAVGQGAIAGRKIIEYVRKVKL